MSFHACFNVAWIFVSICFSVGLFLAMPCKTTSNEKWQQQNHIHIFQNRLPGVAATGSSHYSGIALSEL